MFGCGTGLNFALIEQAIGPDGRIVGVDLTDAMLTQARRARSRPLASCEGLHPTALQRHGTVSGSAGLDQG